MSAEALLARARSWLFVPGSRIERLAKALASGADAVIIDLEDAVAPEHKLSARAAVVAALDGLAPAVPLVLRINGTDTAWWQDDAALARHAAFAALLLPKADSSAQIAEVNAASADKPLLALVETAVGMSQVRQIAAAPGVRRLVFGSIDFQLDMDISDDDLALLPFRAQLVLASRVARLPPPVDGVTTVLDDPICIQAEARRARSLGFGGKLCIHPRQVAPTNTAFSTSADELAWAKRVVAAASGANGAAVAVDGKMVDAPVLARALRLLRSPAG